MFVGTITNWVSVVGQNIPFVTELNTNTKINNNSGLIGLKRGGYWNVDASMTLTGVDDDVIVSLFADGVEKVTTYAEATVTAAGFTTVSLTDAIRTVLSQTDDVATIALRVDTAGVTVNGKIRVEYVQ